MPCQGEAEDGLGSGVLFAVSGSLQPQSGFLVCTLCALYFHWEDKPGWVCCREVSLLLGVERGACNISAGSINGNFARFASLELHLVRDETWLTGPQREFECNRCQCNMQVFSYFCV